jgi:hypothetical protein
MATRGILNAGQRRKQGTPRAPGRARLPLLPSGPGGFSKMPPRGGSPPSLGGPAARERPAGTLRDGGFA